jgi:hypothetical protein
MIRSGGGPVTDTPTSAPAPPDRFLLGIVVGAVALIALGIGVVLALGGRPAPPPPDPGSPVGVVHAYVEALRAGDVERARTFLSQAALAELDRDRILFPRCYEASGVERRILIEPVEAEGDRALVRVTISTFSARTEPFSSSTYHNEVEVRLVREGGQWRIALPIEPFALVC